MSESSAVVKVTPAGISVWIAPPSGASASTASMPPGITPAELENQGEAGISKAALPAESSRKGISVRYAIGGIGIRPSRLALIRSSPVRPKVAGSG